jgi:hypothetical protein
VKYPPRTFLFVVGELSKEQKKGDLKSEESCQWREKLQRNLEDKLEADGMI